MKHIPVLISEVMQFIDRKEKQVVVDATLGGGGYSQQILNIISNSILISFEIDETSFQSYVTTLGNGNTNDMLFKTYILSNEHIVVNDNFAHLQETLEDLSINAVDVVVADLGWSSLQLGGIEGLSFEKPEEKLDMRMNEVFGVTAKDLLHALGKQELKKMLMMYADFTEFEAGKFANYIQLRKKQIRFETVADLNAAIEVVFRSVNSRAGNNLNQTKARIYQALRISVNAEYENLKILLESGLQALKARGRMIIVTFHSGEERIVESFISRHKISIDILSKTNQELFLKPTAEEIARNNKARSAKLWAIEKI